MVSAYVLAGELAGTREDITGAFTRYERKRRPWIGQIQRSAPDSGKTMTPRTAHGITLRNNLVRPASHVPDKDVPIRSRINRSNAFTLSVEAALRAPEPTAIIATARQGHPTPSASTAVGVATL